MMSLLIIAILIVGMFIWSAIDNCRTELRYRNTLLKEQNEILKNEKVGF